MCHSVEIHPSPEQNRIQLLRLKDVILFVFIVSFLFWDFTLVNAEGLVPINSEYGPELLLRVVLRDSNQRDLPGLLQIPWKGN